MNRQNTQEVCHTHPHTHTGPSTASPSLIELMRMTREEWDLWTRGSAIRRAGYAGVKRNVEVAMGNWLARVDKPAEDALEGDCTAPLQSHPRARTVRS